MATSIDTRPDSVDIIHYAGDTLTIQITAPGSITDGKTWLAQVKASRDSDVVDAEFVITPPQTSGGPALLVLETEETARLIGNAAVVRVRDGATARTVRRYVGEWDCQVSVNGDDPVTTLVQGTLTIEQDVTRP